MGAKIGEQVSSSLITPEISITSVELKKLIAVSLYLGIKESFTNYIYTFGGQNYKQMSGGPIGSRLTMACARVIMVRWGRKFKGALEGSGIKMLFGKFYVDDIRIITRLLRNGERCH